MHDKIFLVPHTHYDAIWAFNKEDYFYINTDLILKNAVDLAKKIADYKFTIEQTFLLEYIENTHPVLFSLLKKSQNLTLLKTNISTVLRQWSSTT